MASISKRTDNTIQGRGFVLQIKRYKRTGYNFEVDAVRVDAQNLWEVATWTGGEVCITQDERRRKYVRIYITAAGGGSVRKAYIGEWVIKHDHGGKKVFGHDAFHKSFDLIEPPAELMEAYRTAQQEERV